MMINRAAAPRSAQLGALQTQQLAEIGAYLRQQRQLKSLSLDEVAKRTLVRHSILADIEAGELEQLPEPVYVQGFIRRYAVALGLDAEQVADAFPTQAAQPAHSFWRQLPSAQLRPVHLYATYLIVIATSVHGLSWLMNRSVSQAGEYVRQEQKAEVAQAVAEAAAKSTGIASSKVGGPVAKAFPLVGDSIDSEGLAGAIAADKDAKPPASDKPVQVEMTLTAQSWLRVVVDGSQAYEGVLSEGEQRTWEADEAIVVRAGNAGGVMIKLNDKPAKPMGNPGAVEEVIYDASQAAARAADSVLMAIAADSND